MKRVHIATQKALTKELAKYRKLIEANKKDLASQRLKLTSLRNREQYLRRCVQSIETELGHVKAGQLSFNIEV